MNTRTLFIVTSAYLLLAILLLAFISAVSSKAHATEWDWSLSGDSYHQPRKRVVRKRKPRPDIRYYAPPRPEFDREERFCLWPVRGVGSQWIGPEGALEAAKKDFMERVRYDLGESYLDITHAKDIITRCGRVSIAKVLDQVMYRCEFIARPCKSEFSPGEAGK